MHQILNTLDRIHEIPSHLFSSKLFRQSRIFSRIAGKYIDQYYTRFGISKDAPEPIDPERLASAVLGLNVKMLPLCSDGSVLGLTVFQRCGFTVTLGDGTKLVEIFMPKDVVIDSALAADSCTG